MISINPDKPIRYADRNRMISPDMVKIFFGSFAPQEYKYKLIFACQIATGLRIGEILPMNLLDFMYQEKYAKWQPADILTLAKDYTKLYQFMTDLREIDCSRFKVLLQKKIKENCIIDMDLPVSVASLVREWIFKNLRWIISYEGFIWPKTNKVRPLHLSYYHIGDFLSKRRKKLAQLYPGMGFDEAVSTVVYKEGHGYNKHKSHKLYKFSTHSFRKFHALYGYLFNDKDSVFAKQLLHHEKLQTTEEHYLSHFDFKERRQKYQDKMFGPGFHELVRKQNSEAIAVWRPLKEYE